MILIGLKPFPSALVRWLLILTLTVGSAAFLGRGLPAPTPELMRSIAEIGTTILLAFVIEAAWMATRLNRDTEEEREIWLGRTVGFGLGGLSGIVVALLVAEHRAAGHANFLDAFGLWWSALSLGILGITVIMQPVIATRWSGETPGSN